MSRGDSNWQRRNVLKLVGASSVASVGGVGTAVAADDRVFTDAELERMMAVIRRRAREEVTTIDGIEKEDIPSWLPGLPTSLPFQYCAQIPLLDDICAIAEAPVDIGGFECSGVTYRGVKVSQAVAWGPSVEIEAGEFTGDIQYEASLDLLIDPNKSCPLALNLSSGGGQEACIRPPTCDIDPADTVVGIANNIWDTTYDLVEDAFQQVGYVPPEQVLIAITALAALAFAISLASPVP